MDLRPYQREAGNAVFKAWATDYATMIVMFTGGGKTVIFSDVIRRIYPQKVLVLLHRDVLVWQSHAKITEHTGFRVAVEMGASMPQQSELDICQVVLSSVQTQYAGRNGTMRMHRFDPMQYGAVIVDEVHRYVAPRWAEVVNYWKKNPDLRVLGVTATPDRLDQKSLAQIIPHCCYKMGIEQGLAQAWLVPIIAKVAKVKDLDFSNVRIQKRDFVEGELAKVMEEERVLQGVASVTIQEIGDRKAILFAVRVQQAEKLVEIFNRYKKDCAFCISGHTKTKDRAQLFRDFRENKYQIFCNVGIATEGFDDPTVRAIINARPTLSRALYEQMNGRGLRPWPGAVDGQDKDTPEKRQAAINSSPKPDVLVLDLASNSLRLKLCTVADVLAGDRNPRTLQRLLARMEQADKPVNVRQALQEAEEETKRQEAEEQRRLDERRRKEEERKRQGIKAKATYVVRYVNPFEAQQFTAYTNNLNGKKGLTQNQWLFLKRRGVDPAKNAIWRNYQLLSELKAKAKNEPPSEPQMRYARVLGIDIAGHTKETLSKAIDLALKQKRR